MTFVSLGEDRLKISLDAKEVLRLFGSYEKIDCTDKDTRFALNLLLKQALPESDFKLNCQRLNVEIVKNLFGGCDIFFFKPLKVRCLDLREYVFEFSDFEDSIMASKMLTARCLPKSESRLFLFSGRYRLTGSCWRDFPYSPVLEFAETVFTSKTETAKTEEYGKELIGENALRLLASL